MGDSLFRGILSLFGSLILELYFFLSFLGVLLVLVHILFVFYGSISFYKTHKSTRITCCVLPRIHFLIMMCLLAINMIYKIYMIYIIYKIIS